jgi:hypothetical protein
MVQGGRRPLQLRQNPRCEAGQLGAANQVPDGALNTPAPPRWTVSLPGQRDGQPYGLY